MKWILLPILLLSLGCGQDYTLNPTGIGQTASCTAGVAQIQIGDGYTRILCGCKLEASGSLFRPGETLNCTVDPGAQVVFRFETAQSYHQIIPAPGSPSFLPMAPRLADNPNAQSAYVVTFSTPATTFRFIDGYMPELKGNIIVQ